MIRAILLWIVDRIPRIEWRRVRRDHVPRLLGVIAVSETPYCNYPRDVCERTCSRCNRIARSRLSEINRRRSESR